MGISFLFSFAFHFSSFLSYSSGAYWTPTELSEEALQIAVKRREEKSKGEEERYTHLNAEFQKIARRGKKASSEINAKK